MIGVFIPPAPEHGKFYILSMKHHAFTLVELLVVIAIIGLLSTVAVVSTGAAQMNARNTKRKADLIQISKALDLYYADNGSYPSTGGVWWAACATGCAFTIKESSGPNGWIPNLSPAYMAVLPTDPRAGMANPSSATAGCRTTNPSNVYIYRSNGVDYKVGAHCTPEGTMLATDPFYDPNYTTWVWQISTPGGRNW
jgi:prepilin-type N-terminal cleavage/methylation domain-containing protein